MKLNKKIIITVSVAAVVIAAGLIIQFKVISLSNNDKGLILGTWTPSERPLSIYTTYTFYENNTFCVIEDVYPTPEGHQITTTFGTYKIQNGMLELNYKDEEMAYFYKYYFSENNTNLSLKKSDEETIHLTLIKIDNFTEEIQESKFEDTNSSIILEFHEACCDHESVDPWNKSQLGVKEITWLDNSTVFIQAYVSINCAFFIEGAGFHIYNDTINLVYYVGNEGKLAKCICAHGLIFTLKNFESKEYKFELEYIEISHLK